jgi:glutathione S-transferase
MLPADLSQKAEFLRWFMFDYATLHPAYGKMFTTMFRVQMDEGERTKVLQQLSTSVSGLWAILDKELAQKKFICGDNPTIVDYLATIYTGWGNNFPDIKIALGKNVERLVDEVSALPEFQAAYNKEKIEFKKAV